MIALARQQLRERLLVAAGLAAMASLAWVYLWTGAGMEMSALDMTRLHLFPHLAPDAAGAVHFPWLPVAVMWWVMMVAMMTPSAAPLVLLFERVHRYRVAPGTSAVAATAALAAGYLAAWAAYAAAATGLQAMLRSGGLLSGTMLWSKSALLSAGILAAAGAYQLTPLKRACLAQCRNPVQFLTRYWRPGFGGALAMGMRHGTFCVGCCWMLMALLFVGGVMNLVWIAALAFLVLAEKVVPARQAMSTITGMALLAWSAATLWVPAPPLE